MIHGIQKCTFVLVGVILFASEPLAGQSRVYSAGRIAGTPPTVDGVIDDAAWREATWDSSFVQREPFDGDPATQSTTFALLYDEDNLFFAVRAQLIKCTHYTSDESQGDSLGDIFINCYEEV